MKRMLSTQEAAEYVGLSPGTLANMRVRGSGPSFRRIGSSVRYDIRDLDAWIDSLPRMLSTCDVGD